jgi:putative hydrolase of the HAD superfamily
MRKSLVGSEPLQAVLFDVVGTLLHADPPVVEAYAQVGQRCGSNRTAAEIARHFKVAIHQQDELDRQVHELRTSEARELDRWRCIIAATLGDGADVGAALELLWQHFARSASWRLAPGAEQLFAELERRGLVWGLASNFDGRLPGVCRGIPALATCRHLFVSSELGWRKPSPQFFRAIEQRLGLSPGGLLLVGDDRCNDYEAARLAGWRSVLLGPPDPCANDLRVDQLAGLIPLLDSA